MLIIQIIFFLCYLDYLLVYHKALMKLQSDYEVYNIFKELSFLTILCSGQIYVFKHSELWFLIIFVFKTVSHTIQGKLL